MKPIKTLNEFYHMFDFNLNEKLNRVYYFSKKMALLYLSLVIILVGVALLTAPESKVYVGCNLEGGCYNPYFTHCEQTLVPCDREYLLMGESYGTKSNFLVSNIKNVVGYLALFFLLLNHLMFNRGKLKKIKQIVRESDLNG